MNEFAKTATFCCVAIAIGLVAWLAGPGVSSPSKSNEFKEMIFPEFTDPTEVAALEFVKLNDDEIDLETFRVEKKGGVWSIPSHNGYPSDAADQIVEAADALVDLKIVQVVSEEKTNEKYRSYGVMEPTARHLISYGAESLGVHATMFNSKGEPLVDLIIGKKVKENSALRYVRAVGQDRVVTVKLDTNKLSTRFEDWIETDLLKLSNPTDIRRINLKDYSVVVTPGATPFAPPSWAIEERGDITLGYDGDDTTWSVLEIKKQGQDATKIGDLVDASLQDDEELDEEKLRNLRDALNDLKIINVDRKPEAFRLSLAKGDPIEPTREVYLSLQKTRILLASDWRQ